MWGHLSVPFFRKLRSLSPSLMSQFRPEELQQLYQVELILRLEAPHLGLDVSHIQQYEALFAGWQANHTFMKRSLCMVGAIIFMEPSLSLGTAVILSWS